MHPTDKDNDTLDAMPVSLLSSTSELTRVSIGVGIANTYVAGRDSNVDGDGGA
jgi:hypothetical protein